MAAWMPSLGTAVAVAVQLALPSAAATFAKIADTATPIPGGSGAFESFGRNPSSSTGAVAFRGTGEAPGPTDPRPQGVYSTRSGALAAEADAATAIPDGAGSFEGFAFEPGLGGGAVAWSADGAGAQEGVYWNPGGGAERVADRSTGVPGGAAGELFQSFVFAPVTDGAAVVFHASGDGGVGGPRSEGLYRFEGSALAVVADTGTTMPGHSEAFAFLSLPALAPGGALAFRGRSATGFDGVYLAEGGAISAVVDENTASPSSGLPFASFGNEPAAYAGEVLFRGTDSAGLSGLYLAREGGLAVVADQSTAIPGAGGADFEIFGHASMWGGAVVFEGIGQPGAQLGLYSFVDGALARLIGSGDLLDGKSVAELEISRQSLSHNRLAFWVRFDDGSEGVFQALPEPSALPALAAALALLAALRRSRCP